jgi:hypothetical protein
MQDKLDDLCRKYDLTYGKVFDQYILLEHRMIKRDYTVLGYLFVNRSKYQKPIINVLNRYYRRKESLKTSHSEPSLVQG